MSALLEAALGKVLGAVLRYGWQALTAGPSGAGLVGDRPRHERDYRRSVNQACVQLSPLLETEFGALPEAERLAAVEAVGDSFAGFGAAPALLFEADLVPEAVADHVRAADPDRPARAGLSPGGVELYDRLLAECCLHLVQWVSEQRFFEARAAVELVRRSGRLAEQLDGLSRRAGPGLVEADQAFAARYAVEVDNALNRLELFGVTLSSPGEYQMDTAYLSLSVSCREDETCGQPLPIGGLRVEQALAPAERVLLRGAAGSGKTTLLHWLAVRAAREDFPAELAAWGGSIPFFLPLRRFVESGLPTPELFLAEVGKHLAAAMPAGWVQRVLDAGIGLVLVDGVDELPPAQRPEARRWLRRLIRTFPHCRYVVTSRPAAAEEDWLAADGFRPMELLPMGLADIGEFVRHWHRAVALDCTREQNQLAEYQDQLIETVTARRHLRQLATNPLLCALLCALHRDRHRQLPQDRMGLYAAALEMLLLRRDAERGVRDQVGSGLNLTRRRALLARFAYWLLRNGRTDASREEALAQVGLGLERMPGVNAPTEAVFGYLLERSGLLRAPVEGRMDFVHRTFQEYLAAEAALTEGDVDALVNQAHQDTWHETVVMAVGHARGERERLLTGLLDRGDREAAYRPQLHLLAAACLETAAELAPAVYERIERAAAALVPPSSLEQAQELAKAGELALGLLGMESSELSEAEAAATVRTAALIGGEQALEVVARYRTDGRARVKEELVKAWPQFPAEEYARRVLAELGPLSLTVDRSDQLAALQHLPNLLELRCGGEIDLTPLTLVTSLRSLDLRAAQPLTGLKFLSRMRQLRRLVLTQPRYWPEDLGALGELPSLRALTISRLRHLSALPQLPQLETLCLRQSGEEISLAGIDGFTALRRIDVTLADSFDGSERLLAELPDLTEVEITGWFRGRTGEAPWPLLALPMLPAATELSLETVRLLDGLELIAEYPRLTRLLLDDVRDEADSRAPLDLTPLAGRTGLTVMLGGSQRVRNAERLGPGVKLVKHGTPILAE